MNQLPNIHPGEVLREEFLIPLQISQYRLAKEIGVTEARISTICAGKRAITADTALRLAAFFGTSQSYSRIRRQGTPMRKPSTGEPCAGKPHARFGGRGGREPFPTPIGASYRCHAVW